MEPAQAKSYPVQYKLTIKKTTVYLMLAASLANFVAGGLYVALSMGVVAILFFVAGALFFLSYRALHYQRQWHSGTLHCTAGDALLLEEAHIPWYQRVNLFKTKAPIQVSGTQEGGGGMNIVGATGRWVSYELHLYVREPYQEEVNDCLQRLNKTEQ